MFLTQPTEELNIGNVCYKTNWNLCTIPWHGTQASATALVTMAQYPAQILIRIIRGQDNGILDIVATYKTRSSKKWCRPTFFEEVRFQKMAAIANFNAYCIRNQLPPIIAPCIIYELCILNKDISIWKGNIRFIFWRSNGKGAHGYRWSLSSSNMIFMYCSSTGVFNKTYALILLLLPRANFPGPSSTKRLWNVSKISQIWNKA